MKITETFVADILKAEYLMDYQKIYDKSPMLQYYNSIPLVSLDCSVPL